MTHNLDKDTTTYLDLGAEESSEVHSRTKSPSWLVHLMLGIAVPAFMLLLPWIQIMDDKYTIVEFFRLISESGGVSEYADKTASDIGFISLNYFAMWIIVAAAATMLIRGILGIWGRKLATLGIIIFICFFIYIPVFAYMDGSTPCIGMELTLVAILVDMVAGVYLDQRARIKAEAEAIRERDKQAKAEKKRRMYFEGKYDRDFAVIILKNFRAKLKNYMLFFFVATVAMTLLVIVLGLQDSMGGASLTGNYYQRTVMKTVNQILPIVVVLSLLIITMTITYYIRSCIENYGLYDLLGIRRSTLKIIILTDFFICVFLSLILGLVIGELVIKNNTGEFTTLGITTISILLFLIIIGLSSLINIHIFQYSDIMKLSYPVFSEMIPGRFAKFIVPIGIVVMLIPMIRFQSAGNYEAFSMIIMELAGCLITIYFGGSVIVNHKIRAASKDELKLLDVLDWRYRFRTNIRFVIIIFVLHFLAFAVCLPKLAANGVGASADELAPYDRVLLAYDEDTAEVDRLLQSQDVSASKYEILRATTPLGDEVSLYQRSYGGVLWPQGQHIIISESEYEKLCKDRDIKPEDLELDSPLKNNDRVDLGEKSEHKVFVIMQQDAAISGHKLDWYGGSNNRFKIGQPLEYYDFFSREKIFKDHEAGYAKQILIGSLRGGVQENIIVVDDEYFRSVYDKNPLPSYVEKSSVDENGFEVENDIVFEDIKEGATYMYLINYGKNADVGAIDKGLKNIADRHKEERSLNTTVEDFYNSEKNAEWTVHLRNQNSKLNAGMIAALLATSIVIMGIKYMLGIDDKRRQYTMLATLGMRHKDRKRLYNRETRTLIWGSYAMALVISLPFILGIIGTRMMSESEATSYIGIAGVIIAMYTIIYAVAAVIVRNALRKV